jgi:hypothetical protein
VVISYVHTGLLAASLPRYEHFITGTHNGTYKRSCTCGFALCTYFFILVFFFFFLRPRNSYYYNFVRLIGLALLISLPLLLCCIIIVIRGVPRWCVYRVRFRRATVVYTVQLRRPKTTVVTNFPALIT